jgi:plastocyanin
MLAVITAVCLTAPALSADSSSTKNVTIGLMASGYSFNTSTITVPAGSHITVMFDNRDSNVPHNFAVYDSAANKITIFKGEIIRGPKKITYTFDAPIEPGTYHFQCDPHAKMMNGQFIVT